MCKLGATGIIVGNLMTSMLQVGATSWASLEQSVLCYCDSCVPELMHKLGATGIIVGKLGTKRVTGGSKGHHGQVRKRAHRAQLGAVGELRK